MNHICCPVRKAFLLYIDLDPTPGTFHTPGSAYTHIQGILDNHLSYYRPIVTLVKVEDRRTGPITKRACFAVFVNLDPDPGVFHSQESAQHTIRGLLRDRVSHYNPSVSLAPDSIQPDNILKGTIEA